jgi:serine/threonine-protein kinase OSR1/STK39
MKKLKREGKRAAGLDKGWVQYILGEVLQGLRYLHDNKLIHRDIKAGNILLNGRGEVMIADFGQTTFMQERGKDRQHATFTGTVCWMAPEVMAQESGYSYPADVWSIGITALELAKGYAPYAMFSPMKVLLETLQQPPPTIKSYEDEKNSKHPRVSGTEWAHKSSAFKKFVAACLKRNPSERSNAATLAGMKFVSHGKAGAQVARAMFAREICAEIRDPIHAGKSSGEAKTGGEADAGNSNEKPDWDFSDILGEGDGECPNGSPEVASAAVRKEEVNDDNFGDMFSAAGLGGL